MSPPSPSVHTAHQRASWPKDARRAPRRRALKPRARAAAVSGSIVLKYPTSWNPAFIHYKVEGGEWTDPPGTRMEAGGEGVQTVALEGAGAEFVFTNGDGKWDKPVSGKNYEIAGPGEYVVSDGKIVPAAAE